MSQLVEVAAAGRRRLLSEVTLPLALTDVMPAGCRWELEVGFGKGRFLLRRAAESPDTGFCGIEMARRYYRLAARRAAKKSLHNTLLMQGEALYLLSVALPLHFACAIHVYFPDPWPKSRHHKRRFLDPEAVDLMLEKMRPGATLFFATDHLGYGETVREVLAGHPALELQQRDVVWEDGPRTNYEAKYVREGRPILRLEARLVDASTMQPFHPAGRLGVVAATESLSR